MNNSPMEHTLVYTCMNVTNQSLLVSFFPKCECHTCPVFDGEPREMGYYIVP